MFDRWYSRRHVLKWRLRSIAIGAFLFELTHGLLFEIPRRSWQESLFGAFALGLCFLILVYLLEIQKLNSLTLNEKLRVAVDGHTLPLDSSERQLLSFLMWRESISMAGLVARFLIYGSLGLVMATMLLYGSGEFFTRVGVSMSSVTFVFATSFLLGGYAYFFRFLFYPTAREQEIVSRTKALQSPLGSPDRSTESKNLD